MNDELPSDEALERLLGAGCPDAVIVGQSLDLIVPERQRERHWAGWRQVVATGSTRYGSDLLKVPRRPAAVPGFCP